MTYDSLYVSLRNLNLRTNEEIAIPLTDEEIDRGLAVVRTKLRTPARRRRTPLLVVAVALIALGVGGGALALVPDLVGQQADFHAKHDAPSDAQRLGPLVPLVAADSYELIGWRSEHGLCLDIAVVGNEASECGVPFEDAMPPGSDAVPRVVTALLATSLLGDGRTVIGSYVSNRVTSLSVHLSDGSELSPQLSATPSELAVPAQFFLAVLPAGAHGGTYTAFGSDGSVLERGDLG
jgi:hypothetical protein